MDSLESGYEQLSVFSAFLKDKITEKGWSIKEFADIAGLGEKYAYKLVSPKRDFVPSDETVDKILKALNLPDEEGQYLVDVILVERKEGKPVYPGHSELPTPPSLIPEPTPEPIPPVPCPPCPSLFEQLMVWIKEHKKVLLVIVVVVLLVFVLMGCGVLGLIFFPFWF